MDNHSYMDLNEFCIRDESLLGLKGFKELKCCVAGAEEKLSAVAWGWVLFPPRTVRDGAGGNAQALGGQGFEGGSLRSVVSGEQTSPDFSSGDHLTLSTTHELGVWGGVSATSEHQEVQTKGHICRSTCTSGNKRGQHF